MKLHVPDMSCGHCTAAITKEIAALDPQATVSTDLDSRTVDVSSSRSGEAILQAIRAAGYEAVPRT